MREILWAVMPVYNEEASVARVLDEWVPCLRAATGAPFRLCALNDGSRDGTLAILKNLQGQYPELMIVDKHNSGHGQTCAAGYKKALQNKAQWVFQLDSDGQCDPAFFKRLWDARDTSPAVYGYRKKREDGFSRFLISRAVTLVTFFCTGIWVRDANVPYRLMRSDTLAPYINRIPADFRLVNILLAALQKKHHGIAWVDIVFRDRFGGTPSLKAFSFFRHGILLARQLRQFNDRASA